jgi:hypothetical protein
MPSASKDVDWICVPRNPRGAADQPCLLKRLLRSHQPHLDALFDTDLAMSGKEFVDVEIGDFSGITHRIDFAIKFAERRDPPDSAPAGLDTSPQGLDSNAERTNGPHASHHNASAHVVHAMVPVSTASFPD